MKLQFDANQDYQLEAIFACKTHCLYTLNSVTNGIYLQCARQAFIGNSKAITHKAMHVAGAETKVAGFHKISSLLVLCGGSTGCAYDVWANAEVHQIPFCHTSCKGTASTEGAMENRFVPG